MDWDKPTTTPLADILYLLHNAHKYGRPLNTLNVPADIEGQRTAYLVNLINFHAKWGYEQHSEEWHGVIARAEAELERRGVGLIDR